MSNRGSKKPVPRQGNKEETIHDAVLRGSFESVVRLLQHGNDPDFHPPGEFPPIFRAIRLSRPDIALALIKAGCQVSWPCRAVRIRSVNRDDTQTPLICLAAKLYMKNVVLEMCKRPDCDIFARTCDSSTVMHIAVSSGNIHLVKELLLDHHPKRTPFLELRDDRGYTPIHTAAMLGDVDILSVLLGCQNKTTAVNKLHSTPPSADDIALETEGSRTDHVDFQRKLVNMRSLGQKQTPLHLASSKRHIPVMKFLIDNGANVNLRNIDGNTPLHCLCMEGIHTSHRTVEAAKLLLEAGADCNMGGIMGFPQSKALKQMTVPMMAAFKSKVPILQLCGEHGADFTAKNHCGMTALMLALDNGNVQAAEYLLTHQQEEDARVHAWSDDAGRTPMHLVSHCHSKAGQLAKMLLDQGYAYKQLTGNGLQTCSRKNGCSKVPRMQPPLIWAICHNQFRVARAICEHDPSVLLDTSRVKRTVDSPLHIASRSLSGTTFLPFCHLLVTNGVDPEFKVEGRTALDFAKERKNSEAVRLLEMITFEGLSTESDVSYCNPISLKHIAMGVVRHCVRRRRHDFAKDMDSLPLPKAVIRELAYSYLNQLSD